MYKEIFNIQKEKINEIISFTYNNNHSEFYKKKYKELPIINSYSDFQKIPFLEKKEIMGAGLKNFTFTNQGDVIRYMFSSGTTGKPLITSHNKISPLIPEREKLFEKLNLKKILILFPVSILNDKIPAIPNNQLGIPGDINNLPLMSEMIKKTDINGIVTTPTILEFFIIELKKKNFNFEQIKWIELSGEFCTHQRTKLIENIFPNAYIEYLWGSTETGGHKGYRCEHLYKKPSNIFHFFTNHHFLEIINEKGAVLESKQEGEIVHTDLYKKATTLIRYKTGDLGKINITNCPCGNPYTIELLGRMNYDRLKIQGTVLHTQAIENALDKIREYIEPGFRMNVYEKKIGSQIIPKLALSLILKDKNNQPYLKEIITEKISKNLYLTPTKTLYDLVDKKIFMPLSIKFTNNFPKENKTKHIIPDINI
jgi:phenylacetate-CoA ligase